MKKEIKKKKDDQLNSIDGKISRATEMQGDLTVVDGQIRTEGKNSTGGVGAINPNNDDASAYLGFSGEGEDTVARIRLRGDGEGADGPFQIQERGDRVRMSVERDGTTINGTLNVKEEVTAPKFSGDLSGNATTASTLETPRKINGVSFDGSENITLPEQLNVAGNAETATRLQNSRMINGTPFNGEESITTANWGTGRNLTIGNTAKLVNGSGNVAWTLAEIGAAPATHTHNANDINTGILHIDRIPNINAERITSGTLPYELIPFGTGANDVARGDHTHPAQTTITGNAGTATTLQTNRTINGTNFNGSANITTANWGTARNITIGSTTRSVNGNANVSWSLSDLGIATGTVTITPRANQPTSIVVAYGRTFSARPRISLTPHSAHPGTAVRGVGVDWSNLGAGQSDLTHMRIWITRTDTHATVIHWTAIR